MKPHLATALICTIPALGFAAEIPGSEFSFGNWRGAAYTNDENGEFSHCAVNANYISGQTLLFSVNSNATVSVGLANPDWHLRDGERFAVRLEVDRRAPFSGYAYAVTSVKLV